MTDRRERVILYGVIGALFAVLMVIGVASWRAEKANRAAEVCADPANALRQAASQAQLSNGAGGPGIRPVIADSRVVRGELAIIETHCPEKLSDFEDFVDGLRTTDLAPE